MARTSDCDQEIRRGRLQKARQFINAANVLADTADADTDISDAYVTLCIHAGIAASDVICCARLGRYARGDDHMEAIALLGKADDDSAKQLRALLTMKTKAAYTPSRSSSNATYIQ